MQRAKTVIRDYFYRYATRKRPSRNACKTNNKGVLHNRSNTPLNYTNIYTLGM